VEARTGQAPTKLNQEPKAHWHSVQYVVTPFLPSRDRGHWTGPVISRSRLVCDQDVRDPVTARTPAMCCGHAHSALCVVCSARGCMLLCSVSGVARQKHPSQLEATGNGCAFSWSMYV
jgi:hypothetical protein